MGTQVRRATKTIHITENTFNTLFNAFKIKSTNEEVIAAMLYMFIDVFDWKENDFATLIIDYRKHLMEKEIKLVLSQ